MLALVNLILFCPNEFFSSLESSLRVRLTLFSFSVPLELTQFCFLMIENFNEKRHVR